MLGMTSGADWLIAGLGNPEPKYDGTRHNAGFEALDYLAAQWHCDIAKAKWQGLYGTAQVGDHKVVLLKPLTYMNLSGQSIAPAANFYKIPARPRHRPVRRHHPGAGPPAYPTPRVGGRPQRAEKHHREPRHREFRPHPHRHRRQAQPTVRPGRMGAGQAAPRGPQGDDRPLPGH